MALGRSARPVALAPVVVARGWVGGSADLLVPVLVLLGVAGAAVGSFTCVVIDRLPVRRAAMAPAPEDPTEEWTTRPWAEVLGGRSRCSSCARPVRPIENIPVVSWLALRGRCRGCGVRYGGFHPVVEAAVPLVACIVAWRLGPGWRLGPALWLVPVGIALAVIDLRTMILPTKIIWPALGVSVALTAVGAIIDADIALASTAAVGAAVLAGPLAAMWWFVPHGMGFGDVRLAVLLGWTIGAVASPHGPWAAAFLAIVSMTVAAVVGIVAALVAMAIGRLPAGRGQAVPFGASLVPAAFVVIALADTVGTRFA